MGNTATAPLFVIPHRHLLATYFIVITAPLKQVNIFTLQHDETSVRNQ